MNSIFNSEMPLAHADRRVRWEVMITTTGGDYKISNDHIAFYARLFVKVHPQYRFIFNLKRMRDEPWHGDMPL